MERWPSVATTSCSEGCTSSDVTCSSDVVTRCISSQCALGTAEPEGTFPPATAAEMAAEGGKGLLESSRSSHTRSCAY